jgi:hypothetical protein
LYICLTLAVFLSSFTLDLGKLKLPRSPGLNTVACMQINRTQINVLHFHRHIKKYAANEGLVRIQYECLVPIYVFPEMKLSGLVISKTEL